MIYYGFAISDKRDHDEPHITEEIFFSHRIWHNNIDVKVLVEPLEKHGVLDEASLRVMYGLRHGWWAFMDGMHYVMYKLGEWSSNILPAV